MCHVRSYHPSSPISLIPQLAYAKRRRAAGIGGANVDYSLEASSLWARIRAEQLEKNRSGGDGLVEGEGEGYNAHAFEDMTDLQNENFVYSL